MLVSFQRLLLGFLLILGISALLLFSDLGSRLPPAGTAPVAPAPGHKVRVALLQQASAGVLDDGRTGFIAGLADRGWADHRNLDIKFYNAQGDLPTAQTIAKEMAGGRYDLLVSLSTPSLQAVANANKTTHTPHVFALVTDPYGAGVGISRENHLKHPPYMAGFGTMQPIAEAFKIAREMNPGLAAVGVVYNASESNTVPQLALARQVCAAAGINLLEATVDGTSGVGEAASSLIARGAEALWLPGDVTVSTAADVLIATAKKGHIPVFSVLPPQVRHGALFDVGADYPAVGRVAGQLAGDILNGRDPATVSIENVMPQMLMLNLQTAASLRPGWAVPDAMKEQAQVVIDEHGVEHSKIAAAAPARAANPNPSGKKWKIEEVLYNETASCEETLDGIKDAWKRSALVEGRDYQITRRSAQGDIASLSGIMDAALTDRADLILSLSTPTLQVALQRIKHIPIVFTFVSNPMAAGAGKSYTDHLPNVTGITVLAPIDEALDLIQREFPQYKHFGTLFCPAETNSVYMKDAVAEACHRRGLTLDAVAANTPGELPDAALAMVTRPIDAVMQISDNLSTGGFTAITRAARQARKPLLSLSSATVPLGAPLAFGRDYYNSGEATVPVIERVIAGESPGDIPFALPPKIVSVASPANAAAVGMTLPDSLLRAVDKVVK